LRGSPSAQLEGSARHGLRAAVSPNERLLGLYHPHRQITPLGRRAHANKAIAFVDCCGFMIFTAEHGDDAATALRAPEIGRLLGRATGDAQDGRWPPRGRAGARGGVPVRRLPGRAHLRRMEQLAPPHGEHSPAAPSSAGRRSSSKPTRRRPTPARRAPRACCVAQEFETLAEDQDQRAQRRADD
jgi:hypothetical protein